MGNRVGTGVSSKHRIYQVTVTATVTALAALTGGNAKNKTGVTVLPVALSSTMSDPQGPSSCVQGMNIRNIGTETMYILSASDDSVGAGYPLLASEATGVDLRDALNTYLACASGKTTTAAVWEV